MLINGEYIENVTVGKVAKRRDGASSHFDLVFRAEDEVALEGAFVTIAPEGIVMNFILEDHEELNLNGADLGMLVDMLDEIRREHMPHSFGRP